MPSNGKDAPLPLELIALTVVSGTEPRRRAVITLCIRGEHKTADATVENGGTLHASVAAIKKIVPHHATQLNSILSMDGEGTAATAVITSRIEFGKNLLIGVGVDTDTPVAQVKAYLHALNQYLTRKKRRTPRKWDADQLGANLDSRRPW